MNSLESSLKEVEPIMNGSFRHPSFQEIFTAEQFAYEINSGWLGVKQATHAFWLYDSFGDVLAAQEDSGYCDDLPHGCYFEPDGLRSKWMPVLARLAEMLNEDKAMEFVDIVGEFHADKLCKIERIANREIYSGDDKIVEDLVLCAKFIGHCKTLAFPEGTGKKILDTLLGLFYAFSSTGHSEKKGAILDSWSQLAIDALSITHSPYVLNSLIDYVINCGNVANYAEYCGDAQFATLARAHDAINKLEKNGISLDDKLAGCRAIGYNGDYRGMQSFMGRLGGLKCFSALVNGLEEYARCGGQEVWLNSHFLANKMGYLEAIFSIIKRNDFDPKLIRQFNDELSKRRDDDNLMKIYRSALQAFAQSFKKDTSSELYEQLEKNSMQFWDYWMVYKPK